MNKILFTPPYPILFGRIYIEHTKTQQDENNNGESIDESFYEGFSQND